MLWSLWLGFRLLLGGAGTRATMAAMFPCTLAATAVTTTWLLQFHRG